MHNLIFMFKFHNNLLPSIILIIFITLGNVHNYNIRVATLNQSYYLLRTKTNYRLFNIRFYGAECGTLLQKCKIIPSRGFKDNIKKNL